MSDLGSGGLYYVRFVFAGVKSRLYHDSVDMLLFDKCVTHIT